MYIKQTGMQKGKREKKKKKKSDATYQPGVQETKSRLASSQTVAVDELNDTGKGGGSARGTIDSLGTAAVDNLEVGSGSSDVGVGASGRVVVLGVAVAVLGEPGRDLGRLPVGAGKVVGEAAAAVDPGLLRGGARGAADHGDVGAAAGEVGLVGLGAADGAAGADAGVARGEEDGHTGGAELHELVARGRGDALGDGALVAAVGDGDDVGALGGAQGEQVLGEVLVDLVVIAADRVELVGDLAGDGAGVLDVEVGLNANVGAGGAGRALAAVDAGASVAQGAVAEPRDGELAEEGLEVGGAGPLLDEAGDTHLTLGQGGGGFEVVQGRQSSRGRVGDLGSNVSADLGRQGLEAEEGRGLNGADVLKQNLGQADAEGTGSRLASLAVGCGQCQLVHPFGKSSIMILTVAVVLGVEELLGLADGSLNNDNVATLVQRSSVGKAVVAEPLHDELPGLLLGSNDGINLITGHVLTILGVTGSSNLCPN